MTLILCVYESILVIRFAFRASHLSSHTSQECGLPALSPASVGYFPSPGWCPRPDFALFFFALQQFPWAGENCPVSLLGLWVAGEHPKVFLKVRFSSPSGDCPYKTR